MSDVGDHRYTIIHAPDGDYIVLQSIEPSFVGDGYHWVEHTRWLIPGTQL